MLVSQYYPGWYLGTFPDRRIILASYEADFAETWGRKVRDCLEEVGMHFFGIKINPASSSASRWDLLGHTGGMSTAGVGGPITGKGAHLLIIDDPIKNAEEANSSTIRERHKDWWRSTAYTRLEPGGAVIVMCTRWHEDDLPGYLIKEGIKNNDPWQVINLPAIAKDDDPIGRQPGEALWPERYGVDALAKIRKETGEYWFAAQYGGSPQPAEGGCFKRSWFRYWSPVQADPSLYRLHLADTTRFVKAKDCRRFATVDLAFSLKQSADYTVIAAWAATRDSDLILLDLVQERIDGPDIVPTIARMAARHRLDYVGIEDVQAQSLVLRDAKRKGLAVVALKADKDKVTRAIPATVRMEAEQLFLPQSHPLLGTIENELLTFPSGTHDDIVDCIAYAAREIIYRGGSSETDDEKAARKEREAEEFKAKQEAYMQPTNPVLWR